MNPAALAAVASRALPKGRRGSARRAPSATRGQPFQPLEGPGKATDPGAASTPAAKRRDELRGLRQAAADLDPWDPARGKASRIHGCGRTVVGGAAVDAYIGRSGEGAAQVYGVQTCGSVWQCAVCRARAGAHHLDELQHVGRWWTEDRGGRVMFLTLTVRHSARDELESLRRGLAQCWGRFVEGRQWQTWKREHDAHYVRALDATLGEHGWHLHFHCLLFVQGDLDTHRTKAEFAARWRRIVGQVLGPEHVPDGLHACRLQAMREGDALPKYIAKLGLELTHDLGKHGDDEADRIGGFTPWQCLRELQFCRARAAQLHKVGEYAEAEELQRIADAMASAWRAWWRGMKRARWMTWSVGLREAAGLGVELTDEEAAAIEDERPAVVARIPCDLRRSVLLHRQLVAVLLDAADRGLPLGPFVGAYLGTVAQTLWEDANEPFALAEWAARRPAAVAAWAAQVQEMRRLALGKPEH